MKKLKWTFWGICFVIAAWNINAYRLGVEGRASVEKWTYEDSPDGRYTLAYGYAPDDWCRVQLRRNGESEVLADRWFQSQQPTKLAWSEQSVYYQRGGDEKPIRLPPIWLEKWFAKLP
jgi:hypothetical protein